MKENTWKHNINSGKAAPQSPARHLQFKLLTAVLGNKDEKLDNDPGNIFAITTATIVQVALYFFPDWRKTGQTVPDKKKKTTNICILVKSKCYWRWEPLGVLWTCTEATAPTQPLHRAAPPKCSKPQPWQTPPENT